VRHGFLPGAIAAMGFSPGLPWPIATLRGIAFRLPAGGSRLPAGTGPRAYIFDRISGVIGHYAGRFPVSIF